MVKILLAQGAEVNQATEGTQWTPLHAAAIQEAGECCAILLESGADALAEDSFQRRPVDYASVTPEVWPLFEARGLDRTAKEELVEKSIIKKVNETTRKWGEKHDGNAHARCCPASSSHLSSLSQVAEPPAEEAKPAAAKQAMPKFNPMAKPAVNILHQIFCILLPDALSNAQ